MSEEKPGQKGQKYELCALKLHEAGAGEAVSRRVLVPGVEVDEEVWEDVVGASGGPRADAVRRRRGDGGPLLLANFRGQP